MNSVKNEILIKDEIESNIFQSNEGLINNINDLRDKISNFFKDTKNINKDIKNISNNFDFIINSSQPIPKPISEKLLNNSCNLKCSINLYENKLKNFFEDAKIIFKEMKEKKNKQRFFSISDNNFKINENNNNHLKLEIKGLKQKLNDLQGKLIFFQNKSKNNENELLNLKNCLSIEQENNNKKEMEVKINENNEKTITEKYSFQLQEFAYLKDEYEKLKKDFQSRELLLINTKIEILDLRKKIDEFNSIEIQEDNLNKNDNEENNELKLKEKCKNLQKKIKLQKEEIENLKSEIIKIKGEDEIKISLLLINGVDLEEGKNGLVSDSVLKKYKDEINSLKEQNEILKEYLNYERKNKSMIDQYIERESKNNLIEKYENEIKSLKSEKEELTNQLDEFKKNNKIENSINNLSNSKINNININNMNNSEELIILLTKFKNLEEEIEKLKRINESDAFLFDFESKDDKLEEEEYDAKNLSFLAKKYDKIQVIHIDFPKIKKFINYSKKLNANYISLKRAVKNLIKNIEVTPNNKKYCTEIIKYFY